MAAIWALNSSKDLDGATLGAGLPRRFKMAVKEKPVVNGAMASIIAKIVTKILLAIIVNMCKMKDAGLVFSDVEIQNL